MPSEEHGAWTPLPVSADPVQLRRPDPELPIFFMHIPRTGGFTLKHLLEGVYGSRHTLLDLHKYDTKKIDPAAYKVIEGHVGFKKARSMAGAPNTVTIVREPIARTISVARHLRLYGSDEHFGPLKSGTVDPRAIFEAIPDLSNAQVKQLANRLPRASADPQHLLWACAVLDSVTFGLTEQFPISMALMAERFGLRLPRFGVSNASPADGDADLRSDEFREVAAEYNQLDLQLYDHARSVFQTRQTHYVDALRSMSLQPGQLSGVFRGARRSIWDAISLPQRPTEVRLHGWLHVDGRPADAVLVDGGEGWVPLLARQGDTHAAWTTRSPADLYAGVSGQLLVPRKAVELTVEAYDRTEGRRASRTIPIQRRGRKSRQKRIGIWPSG